MASNTSDRIIIIVTAVNSGLLLAIIFVVVMVKFKRQRWPPRLLTPVDIPLETAETSPRSQLPIDSQVIYIIEVINK